MNPEFRRNLWLEVTVHRLILIPIIVVAVAVAVHLIDRSNVMLRYAAFVGALILTAIWGTRQAASAVLEEARERTWDTQRMSALAPWTMTWGKLAGATIMPWYGGGLCLLVYVAVAPSSEISGALDDASIVILAALTLHGLALTLALVGMHLGGRGKSRLGDALFIIAVIVLLPNLVSLANDHEQISWYGTSYPARSFVLVSVALAAGWAVLAAQRMMCLELQVPTLPWAWVLFGLYTTFFVTGLVERPTPGATSDTLRAISIGVPVSCALTYAAAFALPRDTIQIRRLLRLVGAGDYLRALEELPVWVASAGLGLVLATICAIAGSAPGILNDRADNLGSAALAIYAMTLRDIGLLVFFSFRGSGRRAAATTLVYILVLDWLAPTLLRQLGMSTLAAVVLPPFFDSPITAIVILAAQAALVWYLAVRAYAQATAAFTREADRRS